ncbi:hypothetical protein MPTK1_2g00970 [Marchantia polymorpha subsp. ruderalis]|uniref:Uncharacterized protein n=1 Tax=Marchantia polymorpha TaxID=3197 RepID=A0A2R6X9F4_MARPO|nr:hypothetical protein MARPO_0028s0054 [Marchantia polymorpha]BBN00659.1 hypothetical protein Mp_2g00970 [Marchantia polymorpha subsp. ruderalis]|eukprot:PTQ42737.1 hypothetical protein MARPO_0028s0054 [Marchantia polymorpha]
MSACQEMKGVAVENLRMDLHSFRRGLHTSNCQVSELELGSSSGNMARKASRPFCAATAPSVRAAVGRIPGTNDNSIWDVLEQGATEGGISVGFWDESRRNVAMRTSLWPDVDRLKCFRSDTEEDRNPRLFVKSCVLDLASIRNLMFLACSSFLRGDSLNFSAALDFRSLAKCMRG